MRLVPRPLSGFFAGGLGCAVFGMALALMGPAVPGQPGGPGAEDDPFDPMTVLTQQQWGKVDAAIDRALAWIAIQQRADGSFPTYDTAQPAVTSLAAMAFLARGHLPGEGPHGAVIDGAIEFVLTCQQPAGLLAKAPTSRHQPDWRKDPRRTAPYNHGIGSVFLCEVYGMTSRDKSIRIRSAIERALDFTLADQRKPKRFPLDQGGWRYVDHLAQDNADADLSTTCLHLMFLRSAKNAGFEVPTESIDAAMEYVKRCYKPQYGTTTYGPTYQSPPTRVLAGAAITALSLGGLHKTKIAQSAADYLLANPFTVYNQGDFDGHFHYGAYHATLGMFQIGGHHWQRFFPQLVRCLLENQAPAGNWALERNHEAVGIVYTTALAVNALSVPYQLIPIYQR